MRSSKIKDIVSSLGLVAVLFSATTAKAAPVRFNQVVQTVNPKLGKSVSGNHTQLSFGDINSAIKSVGDDTTKPSAPAQDGRVIVTSTSDIVLDEQCDCVEGIAITRNPGIGFPKWALLGLAAVPAAFLFANNNGGDALATPTPVITPGPQTPTPGPQTPTPTTPTPATPTPTAPTETPTITPNPEPVPEPMTILLFGTGLASIGVAARKRLRRKSEE